MADSPRRIKRRVLALMSVGVVLVAAAIIYASRPDEPTRSELERLSDARLQQLALTVQVYADRHGRLPDSLEQALALSADPAEKIDDRLTNPLTGQNPGYIYRKPPIDDVDFESWTPIVFEALDGRVEPQGAIGYINGSVRRP